MAHGVKLATGSPRRAGVDYKHTAELSLRRTGPTSQGDPSRSARSETVVLFVSKKHTVGVTRASTENLIRSTVTPK